MSRPQPAHRTDYPHFEPLTLRWHDNDLYGHVNNARYYDLFDTAVNGHLLAKGALDLKSSPGIFLVVSTSCDYFAELAFPEAIEAGLRIDRLGSSSLTYAVALFKVAAPTSAATGRFVHVYVDRHTRRPIAIPETIQTALAPLIRS